VLVRMGGQVDACEHTTSEVFSMIDTDMVIDSEISNAILEETIIDTISPIPVSPVGIAIGLIFGLPFF